MKGLNTVGHWGRATTELLECQEGSSVNGNLLAQITSWWKTYIKIVKPENI